MDPPRIELGSQEPESHMLPLHHGSIIHHISLMTLKIYNTFVNETIKKHEKENENTL